MAKNRRFEGYPAACLAELDRSIGLAIDMAAASGYPLEDVQHEVVLAVLTGVNPKTALPAALGVRRLPHGKWLPNDLHVIARFNAIAESQIVEMPAPKQRRSALVAGLAVDQGIGLRAAQKRVQKMMERAGQGDLFAGGEG